MHENHSQNIIELSLQLVRIHTEMYIDMYVLSHAIKVLTQGMLNKGTVALIAPHMEDLLLNYSISVIRMRDRDVEIFETNPVEHVRTQHEVTLNWAS